MPYPYQFQSGGFGGNAFSNSSNPSTVAYPTGNYTAAARATPLSSAPVSTSAPTNTSLNVSASSKSLNPFGNFGTPDLSYADPNTLNRLNISNLIYSPTAGGYLYAGRNYSGLGNNFGGDPNANRQASQFYNYIGSLPTQQRGSPALMQLYNFGAAQRPPPGPSWNTSVSNFFSNATPFVQNLARGAGFTPQGYFGPYTYGRQTNNNTNWFGLGY